LRIGIVSDVHGNANGLACALERMGDVDELLCVGDIVEEFRFSNDAVAILRDRDARCVLGNHDVGLLGPHGERARSADHVDPDLIGWLASHPLTVDTLIEGHRMVMTHASPCPPHTQYVLPMSPEMKRIGEVDADLVIIGHTHRQVVHRVGRPLVVNPGSVGQARDPHNCKRLSYAVLEITPGEIAVTIDDFTVESHRLEQHTGTPAFAGAGGIS
jgi:putative phosphoesterase